MSFPTSPLKLLREQSRDYARVERAIRYVEANRRRQPELTQIAASVHLSEYHFQRLFQRWAGISPKRFLQFLTKEDAKRRLRESASVLEAALESGLSGSGRLHELLVECEAVTPGEVRRGGEGLEIRYGFHPSPFGECLLASTPRGICALRFVGSVRPSPPNSRRSPGNGRRRAGFAIRIGPARWRAGRLPASCRMDRVIAARPRCGCTCAAPIFRSRCGKPCSPCRRDR